MIYPCAEFNFIATISLPQQIYRRSLLYITFCNLWFNNRRAQNVRSIRLTVLGTKIKLSIHATFSLSKWIMFSLMARTIRHKNLDIESLHAASPSSGFKWYCDNFMINNDVEITMSHGVKLEIVEEQVIGGIWVFASCGSWESIMWGQLRSAN